MPTDKHHNPASQQLQLFESEVTVEVTAAPAAPPGDRLATRSFLRLISNTTLTQSSNAFMPMERLAAIEARLIDRAKYF
jgi:hypothetical protein